MTAVLDTPEIQTNEVNDQGFLNEFWVLSNGDGKYIFGDAVYQNDPEFVFHVLSCFRTLEISSDFLLRHNLPITFIPTLIKFEDAVELVKEKAKTEPLIKGLGLWENMLYEPVIFVI